jgi:hypothetical protein
VRLLWLRRRKVRFVSDRSKLAWYSTFTIHVSLYTCWLSCRFILHSVYCPQPPVSSLAILYGLYACMEVCMHLFTYGGNKLK